MPVLIDKKAVFKPGVATWVGSRAAQGPYAAVFEDDGETAYFYASHGLDGGVDIQDAVHIYDVVSLTDKTSAAVIEIGWSPAGTQAVLMINDHPHAVFDFEAKKGWCRTDFPPSNGEWSVDGHAWDDGALRFFR